MSRVLPILFNTDMVRAISDGRKTVTRRVCKDGNDFTVPDMSFYNANRRTYAVHNYADKEYTDKLSLAERTCPICPGDVLYVRETWCEEYGKYYYRADFDSDYLDACETLSGGYPSECRYYPECVGCTRTSSKIRWRPSIHMPKEAARIWLKVTDVRVERLKDITNSEAEREGITVETDNSGQMHRFAFYELWNSTIKQSDIARYGWDANPWVWVIEFERCEKPE